MKVLYYTVEDKVPVLVDACTGKNESPLSVSAIMDCVGDLITFFLSVY